MNQELVKRTTLYTLALLTSALVALLVWGANKGLDLTDESFYLLSFQHPDEIKFSLAFFHIFLKKTFPFLSVDPTTIRLFRLTLQITTSVLFGYAIVHLLTVKNRGEAQPYWIDSILSPMVIILFIVVGDLLTYSFGPQVLGYTPMASSLSLAAAGMTILSIDSASTSLSKKQIYLSIGAGILTSFIVLIKISTSGLLIVALFLTSFFGNAGHSLKKAFFSSSLVGFGFLGGIVFSCLYYVSPSEWLSNLDQIKTIMGDPESVLAKYTLATKLQHYRVGLNDAYSYFVQAGFLKLPIIGLIAGRLMRIGIKGASRANLAYITSMGMLAYVIFQAVRGMYILNLDNPDDYYRTLPVYAILLSMFFFLIAMRFEEIALRTVRIKISNGTPSWLLIIILPFMVAFGSHNNIIFQTVTCPAPIFAMVLGLTWLVEKPLRAPLPLATILLAVALMAGAETVLGYSIQTYRLATPTLFSQTEKITSPPLKGFYVDKTTHRILTEVKKAVTHKTDFVPGETVMALFDLPGLVYWLNGKSPGCPWLQGGSPDKERMLHYCLSASDCSSSNLPPIIISTHDISPSAYRYMKDAGIEMDKDYQEILTLDISDIKFFFYNRKKLSVYALKSRVKTL